jgi:hypothetical protein
MAWRFKNNFKVFYKGAAVSSTNCTPDDGSHLGRNMWCSHNRKCGSGSCTGTVRSVSATLAHRYCFSYFESKKVSVCYHLAVCVSVYPPY